MSAIVALSGFATCIVVLIVERACSRGAARAAHKAGYLKGYRDALLWRGRKEFDSE
ncbi:MAG: hypothetical protein WCQ16_07885 [Verrucomicrobiae bacterium]